jgi:hypothetical protein
VELSEISIWESKDKSGEPLLKTPETVPAYVPVESVKIGVRRGAGNLITSYGNSGLLVNCGRYTVTSVADAGDRPVTLEAVYTPDYADNLFVDWKIIIDNSGGGITLTQQEGDETTGWKRAALDISSPGNVVVMAVSRDSGLADHCIEIEVRQP